MEWINSPYIIALHGHILMPSIVWLHSVALILLDPLSPWAWSWAKQTERLASSLFSCLAHLPVDQWQVYETLSSACCGIRAGSGWKLYQREEAVGPKSLSSDQLISVEKTKLFSQVFASFFNDHCHRRAGVQPLTIQTDQLIIKQ